jgi:hypothetical protein
VNETGFVIKYFISLDLYNVEYETTMFPAFTERNSINKIIAINLCERNKPTLALSSRNVNTPPVNKYAPYAKPENTITAAVDLRIDRKDNSLLLFKKVRTL